MDLPDDTFFFQRSHRIIETSSDPPDQRPGLTWRTWPGDGSKPVFLALGTLEFPDSTFLKEVLFPDGVKIANQWTPLSLAIIMTTDTTPKSQWPILDNKDIWVPSFRRHKHGSSVRIVLPHSARFCAFHCACIWLVPYLQLFAYSLTVRDIPWTMEEGSDLVVNRILKFEHTALSVIAEIAISHGLWRGQNRSLLSRKYLQLPSFIQKAIADFSYAIKSKLDPWSPVEIGPSRHISRLLLVAILPFGAARIRSVIPSIQFWFKSDVCRKFVVPRQIKYCAAGWSHCWPFRLKVTANRNVHPRRHKQDSFSCWIYMSWTKHKANMWINRSPLGFQMDGRTSNEHGKRGIKKLR